MSECKYTYNNRSYDYKELVEVIRTDPNKELGILYSVDPDRQTQLYDKITELKKDFKLKSNKAPSENVSTISTDEYDVDVPAGYYTLQTFIDSGNFDLAGNAPGFRLNYDEYLKLEYEKLMKAGYSEEDAKLKTSLIKTKWDKMAKDGSDLHRIIVSSNSDDDFRHFNRVSLNTSFQGKYDMLPEVVSQVMKEVLYVHDNAHSKLIRNINLEAEIRGLAEKIIGHIDYLVIRPDGELEIFNLKVSKDSYVEWSEAKKEKYKYQLAFLKRILEHHGINVKHIRTNIIPIKLDYDENFDEIKGITVNHVQSYDMSGQRYILQKYDDIVSQYIDSTIDTSDIQNDIFDKVNPQLSKIFPGRNQEVVSKGLKETAKSWVEKNWNSIATQAVDKPGWNILLPGEKESVYISDTRVGVKNEQLLALVEEHSSLYNKKTGSVGISRLISDIKKSYENKRDFFASETKDEAGAVLSQRLERYFSENEKDSEGNITGYNWELLESDTLADAGILLFRHKATNQLDVIMLSDYDFDTKLKTKGRDNLLGYYLPDMNSQNFTMETTMGNIEMVRAMTLLNEIIPKLGNTKLGQLLVVGTNPRYKRKAFEVPIQAVLPQFETIVQVVKSNNPTLKFENNFKTLKISCIDPEKLLIQKFRDIQRTDPGISRDIKGIEKYIDGYTDVNGLTIDGLETISTTEGKIERITSILNFIGEMDPVIKHASPKELIEKYCKDNDKTRRAAAQIYVAAFKALQMYNGDYHLENESFSQMSEYMLKPQTIPNINVRSTAYMFQGAINNVATEMMKQYSPIRQIFMDYYKAIGYSPTQNATIGNHAQQFENLYQRDLQGNRTLDFKNPYDPSSDLTTAEREFLKKILFELNKIRYRMRGLTWEYSSPNDPKLIERINKGEFKYDGGITYLNVPLKRMSKSTRNENIGTRIKEFGKRWLKRITHPKDAFKEFVEDMMDEKEQDRRDSDIESLQAYNPFLNSEMSANVRSNYINNHDVDFFEYDLETLFIEFLEKDIQCSEFNKMLTRTKAILLDLQLRGVSGDDPEAVQHTVKTIMDYLTVNVYNKSIMEDSTQAIEAFLEPIRRAVTTCYIAANPTAAVRDVTQGLLENIVRTITKYQTDINVSDIMHGYKEVITEGPGNVMVITKLNQINLKYRLSNLDVARISEGMKTSGSGVLNPDHWAYATLRSPDYLNRMVLFSARMHHDGVDDAYYIKDGNLVYDWTKDHRFDIYRSGDSKHPEYAKQRSLYVSLLRAFNLENNTTLVEGDALPDAYTSQQITMFKNFADTIYGSYNQSTRAKYENVALGRNFGVFSTWMNGIVEVYTKKRQISTSESKWEQSTDVNGNKEWIDKNGNLVTRELDSEGNPILQEGDVPFMKDVPVMVQGVLYTLKDFFTEWYDNGFESTKNNVLGNEINRRNFRRMFSDLLVWMVLGLLFTCALTPAYQEHKKNARGQDLIQNGLIELTYNGFHNAYDGFKGPFAVLDYIGNSTNPATYKLPTKILNDMGSYLMGNKTFGGLMMGSQALPRSFRDTYRMWVRDTQH